VPKRLAELVVVLDELVVVLDELPVVLPHPLRVHGLEVVWVVVEVGVGSTVVWVLSVTPVVVSAAIVESGVVNIDVFCKPAVLISVIGLGGGG